MIADPRADVSGSTDPRLGVELTGMATLPMW